MASHMKTTVHIADALLREAQRVAARDGTTLKALIDEGLRKVVTERSGAKPFKLRDGSFKGEGLQDDLKNATWNEILERSYEGRGG